MAWTQAQVVNSNSTSAVQDPRYANQSVSGPAQHHQFCCTFQAGPYFTNNFNDDQWQRTLINLIPKLTLSTAQWSRRVGYPPELGIVAPYNAERGMSPGSSRKKSSYAGADPGFPRRVATNQIPKQNSAKLSCKLHENEENWTERDYLLCRSATATNCYAYHSEYSIVSYTSKYANFFLK